MRSDLYTPDALSPHVSQNTLQQTHPAQPDTTPTIIGGPPSKRGVHVVIIVIVVAIIAVVGIVVVSNQAEDDGKLHLVNGTDYDYSISLSSSMFHEPLITSEITAYIKNGNSNTLIKSYIESVHTGFRTYGDFGSVIVFNRGDSTDPIVHRAIIWLEYNDNGTWTSTDLEYFTGNWSCTSGFDYMSLSGILTLHNISISSKDVSIDLNALDGKSGFLTMGDNPITNCYFDQAVGITSHPISFTDITGYMVSDGYEYYYPLKSQSSQNLPLFLHIDHDTGELFISSMATWAIYDELDHNLIMEFVGNSVILNPGVYTVYINDQPNQVMINGTAIRNHEWTYSDGMKSYNLSLQYSIDYSVLARSIFQNQMNNSHENFHTFSKLSMLVKVDDLIEDVTTKLTNSFISIGGSISDRQSYANFLVAPFQQMFWGKHDQDTWGQPEYFADAIEALFLMSGDCDEAAVVESSVLKAAGFKAAIAGVPGYVYSAVALDSFYESTSIDTRNFGVAFGRSQDDPADNSLYYAILPVFESQFPVGYAHTHVIDNIANESGSLVTYQGKSGVYSLYI